jgi:very-short-patch-repair endonuclease
VALYHRGKIIDHCRAMRTDPTRAEDKLWKGLRNRQLVGMKFRRQHFLGPYIVDFYCHEASLAIELDGSGHQDMDQADYDQIRSMELEGMGVKVIRFWNQEVVNNLEGVLDAIKEALTLALSQRERGRKPRSE